MHTTLMNATQSTKRFSTGSTVVFTAEAVELLGRPGNEIFEITDSRHVGRGVYVFSLTPVTEPPTLNAAYRDVWADDLRAVG